MLHAHFPGRQGAQALVQAMPGWFLLRSPVPHRSAFVGFAVCSSVKLDHGGVHRLRRCGKRTRGTKRHAISTLLICRKFAVPITGCAGEADWSKMLTGLSAKYA
jgi:hypothetical protein